MEAHALSGSETLAPARYELRYDYGSTAAGKPGLATGVKTFQQQGTWALGKGIKSNPDAVVYELNGAVSLSSRSMRTSSTCSIPTAA